MRSLRFCLAAAALATAALSGCKEPEPLPDTLMFPPGTPITFNGQPAKLYGTSQCAQGQLTGHSCLIFHPHHPNAKGMVVVDGQVHELELIAKRDPQYPVHYLVQDQQGRTLLTSNGRNDERLNLDITP